jgi:hypothetical protein
MALDETTFWQTIGSEWTKVTLLKDYCGAKIITSDCNYSRKSKITIMPNYLTKMTDNAKLYVTIANYIKLQVAKLSSSMPNFVSPSAKLYDVTH